MEFGEPTLLLTNVYRIGLTRRVLMTEEKECAFLKKDTPLCDDFNACMRTKDNKTDVEKASIENSLLVFLTFGLPLGKNISVPSNYSKFV